MVALLSARGQLDEVSLETSDGLTSFSDDLFPCGFRNPILDVVGALRLVPRGKDEGTDDTWMVPCLLLLLASGGIRLPSGPVPPVLR